MRIAAEAAVADGVGFAPTASGFSDQRSTMAELPAVVPVCPHGECVLDELGQ